MSVGRRRAVLAVLALVFVVAFVAGAYGGWWLWHPMDGLLIWIAAGAIVLLAGALAIVPRRTVRLAALGLAVVGIGLFAGERLGPSRPALDGSSGTLDFSATSPMVASGTGEAFCQFDADATELQVSGDSNLRLDVLPDDPAVPADIDQREFVAISLTVGNRWQRGDAGRADDRNLVLSIGGVVDGSPDITLRATDDSDLVVAWTRAGGSARFGGLANVSETPDGLASDVDLAGTITWTCGSATTSGSRRTS